MMDISNRNRQQIAYLVGFRARGIAQVTSCLARNGELMDRDCFASLAMTVSLIEVVSLRSLVITSSLSEIACLKLRTPHCWRIRTYSQLNHLSALVTTEILRFENEQLSGRGCLPCN